MTDKPAIDWELLESAMLGRRNESQQAIATEGVSLTATLLRKNRDYGSSVWKPPILAPDCDPGIAIRVRMSDKINRLITLLASKEPEVDESIDDTLRDLAGYCLLELARPRKDTSGLDRSQPIAIWWLKTIGFLPTGTNAMSIMTNESNGKMLGFDGGKWFTNVKKDHGQVIEILHNRGDVRDWIEGSGRFKSQQGTLN